MAESPTNVFEWFMKATKPKLRKKATAGKSRTTKLAIPLKQKAVLVDVKFGQVVINTIDVPRPNMGEILVKVQAAALNPLDWKIPKFGIHVDQYPAVLGKDLAGDVVEVGAGVTEVAVGDRVFLQASNTRETGAFQQYSIADAALLAKIPNNLTYDDASTFPVTLVAAYLGLFNENPYGLGIANPFLEGYGKSAGQTIVILGGASSLGQFAIQLAKLAGFSTIIATASPNNNDLVLSQGATHVIDRNRPASELAAEVSNITGSSHGVKYVFDTVSLQQTQQVGYDLLSPDGGQIAIVLAETIKMKVRGKAVNNVYSNAALQENADVLATFFGNITRLLEEGVIKPLRVERLPDGLAGVPGGLLRLELNQVSGFKLVARPQETA